jgi:hypothetical protein
MKTRTALAALTLSALALPLAAVAPATASGGGGHRTSGACSQSSHWKLKAKNDSGRIEVEAEVHGVRVGQGWHWVISHNGSPSSSGRATTHGASRSFSVHRLMINLAGTDNFTLRAVRSATGEVCRGKVSL